MSRLELISYIQQNLKNGFSKSEIRSALSSAGWAETDVELALLAVGARKRQIITTLVVLIITPLLGFGAAWLFTQSQITEKTDEKPAIDSGQISGITTESPAAKSSRDEQRLNDIIGLETALEKYFLGHQLYPKNLNELVTEQLIPNPPTDPKTKEPYLYNPLGEPALYYTISFILEIGNGTFRAGFNSITSESGIAN